MKDIEITSIDHLIKSLNDLPNNYIYRGHSNVSWKLQSTLERILLNNYETQGKKFEKYAIDNFKSRFHLYDKSNIQPVTKSEWLSIMQHYGVPTRMLDFTQSPYVAIYFALENITKNDQGSFVIYAIDFRSVMKKSMDYLIEQDKTIQVTYDEMYFERDKLFNIIDEKAYEILWIVEPSVSNLRIEKQSGCFLISGNIKKTIEQVLKSEIYSDVDNYRFIVPKSFWDNIYTLLQRMNIDSKTIYGDLEGLSKSIKLFIRAYS
jgi:hypothetical protein